MTGYEKKRLRWARVTGCAAVGTFFLLLALGFFLYRAAAGLQSYERRVDDIVRRMEDVSRQLADLDAAALVQTINGVSEELGDVDVHGMVAALDSLSAQLESIDWEELAGNVNGMALETQKQLESAGETLRLAQEAMEDLDITTLNKAITDLQTVITPLAEMMERFQ